MKRFMFLIAILVLISPWCNAQKLLPTESKALLNVLVTDFDMNPLAGETVIFRATKSGKEYSVVTNQQGKAQILLPKGDTYEIKYKELSEAVDYTQFEVPNQPGRFTLELRMKYEPSKVFTLNNVYFDVDKATINRRIEVRIIKDYKYKDQ